MPWLYTSNSRPPLSFFSFTPLCSSPFAAPSTPTNTRCEPMFVGLDTRCLPFWLILR
uniref:Uncharacterized protein n=1 Tax=Arundo donax TaxID=35708 RepID=A0A0A9HFR8_ARUDO